MADGTAPAVWAKSASNPIVAANAAGGTQMAFPTVIKAQGRLGSPIDNWYMWAAPHDSPGGIYLFTASTPGGPWTIRNSSAAVLATPGGGNHYSSPYVLWNPNTSKLMMWWHYFDSNIAGHQRTYLATSTDGISWTLSNSGNPVLSEGASGDADEISTSYLKPYWDGSQFVAWYDGENASADVRFCRATSPDGITWTKIDAASGGSFAPINAVRNYLVTPLRNNGGTHLFYNSWHGTGNIARNAWYRTWLPTGAYTLPRDGGLGVGGIGTQWDSKLVSFNDFVYDGTKLWGFYIGTNDSSTNVGQAIGVASATYPQAGFDTTWGKG